MIARLLFGDIRNTIILGLVGGIVMEEEWDPCSKHQSSNNPIEKENNGLQIDNGEKASWDNWDRVENGQTDKRDEDDWESSQPTNPKRKTFNKKRCDDSEWGDWNNETQLQSATSSTSKQYKHKYNTTQQSSYKHFGSDLKNSSRNYQEKNNLHRSNNYLGDEGNSHYTNRNYNVDKFQYPQGDNNFYDSNGEAKPAYTSITYEPAHLNYDEKQLFERKQTGGIDFSNYEKIDVEMTGGDGSCLDRISSFDQCDLHPQIYENVKRCNYVSPTPIQKSVIPIIAKTSHDIMACAQTGSGKTAAFLLPIFSKILANNEHQIKNVNFVPSPTVLLVGPTRELINQLFMEMQKFSWGTGINCARVYGGVARHFLLKGLKNNCHVLSATPGRLLAFLRNGEISIENVKYLILDEADRMLDMGFINDIRAIINNYGMAGKDSRRCYMFSATFPPDVQKLAAEILHPNFYFITVGMVGGAAESIAQSLEMLPVTKKRERLIEILSEVSTGTKSLIFVETKRQADYLTIYLCESGFDAISIHGDRLQQQREQALDSFINGRSPILVATSVAARGLDIPSVDLVLNYDMPHDVDEYVHRIGRTGRIGHRGLAISFFQENRDESLASDLVKILKNANQNIPNWLQLIAGANLGNSSARSSLFNRTRDVRYSSQPNNKLHRQNFNAMDSHPYANNNGTDHSYKNSTASAWDNDDINAESSHHLKDNDEEYW